MKKFFVVALAVIFCLALSMPAMAKVTLKGKLSTQLSWESTDNNLEQNGTTKGASGLANDQGRDWFELDTGKSSEVSLHWVNDDGNLGLNATMGQFGNQDGMATGSGEISGQIWGWYQINPMLRFSVGELKSLIGGEGLPITLFQTFDGPFPAGNIIFNDVDSGLQLDAKVSDNLELSFMISDNEAAGAWTINAATTNIWAATDEEETSPEFGFRLKGRFGPFSFSPAYITAEKQYAWDVAAGALATAPDSYSGWIATLPVKASIGPATIVAEYNWGENLTALAGWKGTLIGKVGPTVNATATGVDDGEYEGWFIGAMIKGLGPGILGFGYGSDETETGLAAARTVAEATTYGIRYIIPVVKGFEITPFYAVNDYEETSTAGIVNVQANGSTDRGEVDVLGVNFCIKF